MNVANWAEVTPSTIPVPSDPGATTSISLMYLHAVFGLFQYARCIIVDKESPANALAIAWHVGHRTLARDADTLTSERNGINSPASHHEASSLPTMLRTIVRAV